MGRNGRNKDARLIQRNSSLESTASINIGNSRVGGQVADVDDPPPANLFDCSALIIHCRKHDRYALQDVSSKKPGLWFPYAVVNRRSFEASAHGRLKHLLKVPGSGTPKGYAPFSSPECLQILRLQLPHLKKYAQRYTYYTQFTTSTCCLNVSNGLKWIDGKDLPELESKVWGPEPMGMVRHFKLSSGVPKEKGRTNELDIREATRLLSTSKRNTEARELLKQVGVEEKEVLRWYSEFIQHCWPSQAMTLLSFHLYMLSINYFENEKAKKESHRYFRAFAANETYFIQFREFMLGLAASDKAAPMKGIIAELRCGYIFRYYDSEQNRSLSYDEMSRLVLDSEGSKSSNGQKSGDPSKLLSELKIGKNTKVSSKDLAILIGSLKIRGTSSLFRSNISCKQTEGFIYKSIEAAKSIDEVYGRTSKAPTSAAAFKCVKCKDKKYTLSMHDVKLTPTGFIFQPREIPSEDSRTASKDLRRASNDIFSDTLVNQWLDLIREYSDKNKIYSGGARTRNPRDYLKQVDRQKVGKDLSRLCDLAEEILRKEPRVVKVTSPAIVFGDIHGNLHDLMMFERLFWKKGPYLEPWSYLFLGDYVDRGIYSLEVAIYLIACKVQCPNQFVLLRGNHEVRPVNRGFTFYKELEHKLGPQLGPNLWERINKVFDCMPISAVIDDTVFCSHGGIPSGVTGLADLNRIQCPLPDPETQSAVAWEMLWNDPVSNQEFEETIQTTRAQSGTSDLYKTGFIANTKRGTANFFSEDAVRRFLTQNGLSHIIRAHEVCPQGFELKHNGKTITVFSSSRYGNGTNEAAVIFVDKSKIRPVKIDTNV